MFTPIGRPRNLPFPLKDQETNGNITDDLGLIPNDFVWPEDPEERTVVPFLFSQNEFTAIASAVDVGADIAYPMQYIEVYWLLVRSLRYRVPICDLIIDCITNNPATQAAIVNMLINNEEFNEYINATTQKPPIPVITGKLVGGDCDNGIVAGRAIALVESLDTNNFDFLEILEVGTNDEEKLAAFLEAIPIADELPVGDIIDFIQDILEDFGENYAGASTFERKDEMAEDIYCIMRQSEDCSITYEQLFDYLKTKAPSTAWDGLVLIGDVVSFIVDGDFGNDDQLFYGMMALQVATIIAGKQFNGLNVQKIGSIMRDAVTSSRWMDWDECPPESAIIGVRESYPNWTGQPWTFVNNPTGSSSTWRLTFQEYLGISNVSVDTIVPATGVQICVRIVEGSGVDSYQHLTCSNAIVSGSGSGESESVEYKAFGWFGPVGEEMEVTFELI